MITPILRYYTVTWLGVELLRPIAESTYLAWAHDALLTAALWFGLPLLSLALEEMRWDNE